MVSRNFARGFSVEAKEQNIIEYEWIMSSALSNLCIRKSCSEKKDDGGDEWKIVVVLGKKLLDWFLTNAGNRLFGIAAGCRMGTSCLITRRGDKGWRISVEGEYFTAMVQ